ncbi:LysM peptidoglycan-binding domain-containing protein [Actinospongicola halichondriae]|uniref:LysM peptidoglycan-binding domain-containing protein n=1 Tax=Actinospongicola halichondriae TaxID=3236844 RepID=UPI003D3D8A9D
MANLFGADRDTIDAVTDVLGIGAVLVALALFVLLESRRAAGRAASRGLGVSAFAVTVLALVIIGGRFQWIPDAADSESAASVSPSTTVGTDDSTPSTTTSSTAVTTTVDEGDVAPDGADVSTTTVVVGPPAPPAPPTTSPSEAVPPDTVDDPIGVDAPVDPGRGPPAASTYEVVDGDNFWSIAETMLETDTGGPVSDAQVVSYWQTLIDANADQLVEPGNPDLIVPGQMLDVPPIGGAAP